MKGGVYCLLATKAPLLSEVPCFVYLAATKPSRISRTCKVFFKKKPKKEYIQSRMH
jgi:hypothetical protein